MPVRHLERHRTEHIGWLRAAVLGANDGILSTASLVLGVAAAVRTARDGTVEDARIALGAVSSRPFLTKGGELLIGKKLSDDAIAEAGAKVASAAKPMDNTDLDLYWRKAVVAEFVGYALREIRGDDMRATRVRIARHAL